MLKSEVAQKYGVIALNDTQLLGYKAQLKQEHELQLEIEKNGGAEIYSVEAADERVAINSAGSKNTKLVKI